MTILQPANPQDGVVLVRFPAEVDLESAPALRDEMLAALNRDGSHLVVDAQDVTFMDSSGVNALVRARERADRLDGSLHVVSDCPSVRRILEITQLDRRLGLVATLDEAFRCLSHPETVHTCGSGTDR
jgi:anti-anti-sigma factor